MVLRAIRPRNSWFLSFFPQHIVEGLLHSRPRVSDRPSWILIFKTPARKPTNIVAITIVVYFLVSWTRRLIVRVWPGLGRSSTSSRIAILLMIIIIISIIIIVKIVNILVINISTIRLLHISYLNDINKM